MNNLRQAAQQALDALESLFNWQVDHERGKRCGDAVVALRAALEQPEQEPVAWMFQHEETGRIMCVEAQQVEGGFEKGNPRLKKITPLYTAPPQQQAKPVGTAKELFTNTALERLDIRPSTKVYLDAQSQRKPLTEDVLKMLWLESPAYSSWQDFKYIAREIEQAHKIE